MDEEGLQRLRFESEEDLHEWANSMQAASAIAVKPRAVSNMLSRDRMFMHLDRTGQYLYLSLFERNGYRDWVVCPISNFPNDFIGSEDLKRFGINLLNKQSA